MIRLSNIVQQRIKMIHETIVDYYVKFVNNPLYKGKTGRLALLCPYLHRIFAELLLETV